MAASPSQSRCGGHRQVARPSVATTAGEIVASRIPPERTDHFARRKSSTAWLNNSGFCQKAKC